MHVLHDKHSEITKFMSSFFSYLYPYPLNSLVWLLSLHISLKNVQNMSNNAISGYSDYSVHGLWDRINILQEIGTFEILLFYLQEKKSGIVYLKLIDNGIILEDSKKNATSEII